MWSCSEGEFFSDENCFTDEDDGEDPDLYPPDAYDIGEISQPESTSTRHPSWVVIDEEMLKTLQVLWIQSCINTI